MTVDRMSALLSALRQGPCVIGEWAARAGTITRNVAGSVQWLLVKERVKIIGTVAQARAGRIDIGKVSPKTRGSAKVYALPGTSELPPLRLPERRAALHGSGVIAGRKVIRGYLW